MIREFTTEDFMLYAGAVSWNNAGKWGTFNGMNPLILELDSEWMFILSAEGTEVHRVEEREGSTITVYGALNGPVSDMPLAFPTQRFAYSWLVAVAFLYSMSGKFDPADYGMIEIATI